MSLTVHEKTDRKRIILQRRFRDVGIRFELPPLSRRQMHKLCTQCINVLGEDGIMEPDLRVLYKLTARGLFND